MYVYSITFGLPDALYDVYTMQAMTSVQLLHIYSGLGAYAASDIYHGRHLGLATREGSSVAAQTCLNKQLCM